MKKDVAQKGIVEMMALLNEVSKQHPDFVRKAAASDNLFQFIGAQAQAGNPAALEITRLAYERGIMDIGNWDGKS